MDRAECEAWFRAALEACDPALLVRAALRAKPVAATVGIAIGTSALAMANGAGPIPRGVVVTHIDDGRGVPRGWSLMLAPAPPDNRDARTFAAGDAVLDMIASATPHDHVLALISGGVLCARGETAIVDGMLARACEAPITTLAISDVVGDDPREIGGGPTIAERAGDRVAVIATLQSFAWAIDTEIEAGEFGGPHVPTVFEAPMSGDAAKIADELVSSLSWVRGVAWGHPEATAWELALELAKRLRGMNRSALVASTDGRHGGAYVDGTTWDAVVATGIDPRDAGSALGAVGAMVVTGATFLDYGLVVILS